MRKPRQPPQNTVHSLRQHPQPVHIPPILTLQLLNTPLKMCQTLRHRLNIVYWFLHYPATLY